MPHGTVNTWGNDLGDLTTLVETSYHNRPPASMPLGGFLWLR